MSLGQCTQTMQQCTAHAAYLCVKCHSTNSQGYLKQLPSYKQSTTKSCSWSHKKLSYPKHNKKFHNSQSSHMEGFKLISNNDLKKSKAKDKYRRRRHRHSRSNSSSPIRSPYRDISSYSFRENSNKGTKSHSRHYDPYRKYDSYHSHHYAQNRRYDSHRTPSSSYNNQERIGSIKYQHRSSSRSRKYIGSSKKRKFKYKHKHNIHGIGHSSSPYNVNSSRKYISHRSHLLSSKERRYKHKYNRDNDINNNIDHSLSPSYNNEFRKDNSRKYISSHLLSPNKISYTSQSSSKSPSKSSIYRSHSSSVSSSISSSLVSSYSRANYSPIRRPERVSISRSRSRSPIKSKRRTRRRPIHQLQLDSDSELSDHTHSYNIDEPYERKSTSPQTTNDDDNINELLINKLSIKTKSNQNVSKETSNDNQNITQSSITAYCVSKSKPSVTQTSNKKNNIKNDDDLLENYKLWIITDRKSDKMEAGCHVCFTQAINKLNKTTKFEKQQYPLSVSTYDVANKTNNWSKFKDACRHHDNNATHLSWMSVANDSNYFNKLGLTNQIKAYMHMVENGDPDNRYPTLTHLIQETKGFAGNIGRSVHRLDYYDKICFDVLKANVSKLIKVPRPWGGSAPYTTTADCYSQGQMGAEVHAMMQNVCTGDEMKFIAFPIEISPISSHPGQSKKLIDSARRHISAIINLFEYSFKTRTGHLLNNKEQSQLIENFLSLWVLFVGDGVYCAKNQIWTRFMSYLKEIKVKIITILCLWDLMHKLAIAIKRATESKLAVWRVGFLIIMKLILLRLKTPKGASELNDIKDKYKEKAPKILGFNVTRLSEYEHNVLDNYAKNLKYILDWGLNDKMLYKIASSMSIIFGTFAIKDITFHIKKRHLSSQNIKAFPWRKLNYFLSLEKIFTEIIMELQHNIKDPKHKLNPELFPTLSLHEQKLKDFKIYGHHLNDLEFIVNNDVNISSFGKITDILVDTLRTDIISQLEFEGKNVLYCCNEVYDSTKNYIECSSGHPMCPRWVHFQCSKLSEKEFKKLSFSSKKWFCSICKAKGIKKTLSKTQLDKIKKDLLHIQINSDPQCVLSPFTLSRSPTTTVTSKADPKQVTNQQLLSNILPVKYPKPAKSDKNKNTKNKNIYSDSRKRKIWINNINGILNYMKSLNYHMFDVEKGLFNEKEYSNYIAFQVKDIFNTDKWFRITQTLKKMKKQITDKNIKNEIQNQLLNHQAVLNLFNWIKDSKMTALKTLKTLSFDTFMDELTLFIFHSIKEFIKTPLTEHENILTRVLMNSSINDECRDIKTLFDVAWSAQPEEAFAETICKCLGFIYDPTRSRMLFEKLRKRVLIKMWLPQRSERCKLEQAMIKRCLVDGIRAVKIDKRSGSGCVAYENHVNKSKENAMPFID